MPHGRKNPKRKQKQYCGKFNKDFKNSPHQKKKFFLKKCGRRKVSRTPSAVADLKMEVPSGKHGKEIHSANALKAPGNVFSTELPERNIACQRLGSAL